MTAARTTLMFLLTTVALVAIVGCGNGDKPGQSVAAGEGAFTRVTPQELSKMLDSKDFTLVNVHIPYDGELPKTDAFVPYDTIANELDRLPPDKAAKVLLYCRSGRMSTEAAQELVRLGYTNVWELGGGMVAWENAGFTILQTARDR